MSGIEAGHSRQNKRNRTWLTVSSTTLFPTYNCNIARYQPLPHSFLCL